MRLPFFCFFFLFLLTSCIDQDFPVLQDDDNIFSINGPDLFTVVNVAQSVDVGSLRRIQVNFTTIYDQIPAVQQAQIDQIVLATPDRATVLAIDRTQFVDSGRQAGTEVCYSLAFGSSNPQIGRSRSTDFCVMVE